VTLDPDGNETVKTAKSGAAPSSKMKRVEKVSKRLDPVACPRCGSDLVGMRGVRLVCYDCCFVWALAKPPYVVDTKEPKVQEREPALLSVYGRGARRSPERKRGVGGGSVPVVGGGSNSKRGPPEVPSDG